MLAAAVRFAIDGTWRHFLHARATTTPAVGFSLTL